MKKLFWLGFIGLLLFEIANVFFIMPMPGSQRMNSIDLAYFLYKWRWVIRGLFIVMIIAGLLRGRWRRKWVPVIPLVLLATVAYMANFQMAADKMFAQPKTLVLASATENKVDTSRLVIGIVRNGVARAYPIQFLGYHHQVQDEVGGEKVLVTYCTVCRTGRVFDPTIDGRHETFRLVGMDHFNAMLEDKTTGSWWRQATGEAIAGPRKGMQLKEIHSQQTSLASWLRVHPASTIMQADPAYTASYDTTMKYESGLSRNALTGTDSLSWRDKSWVIGVVSGNRSKAYDWNMLRQKRVINDEIDGKKIVLAIAADNASFYAYYRGNNGLLDNRNDSLYSPDNGTVFSLSGRSGSAPPLEPVKAYQEFYHSWRTFHPETELYK